MFTVVFMAHAYNPSYSEDRLGGSGGWWNDSRWRSPVAQKKKEYDANESPEDSFHSKSGDKAFHC
jgi:hypothetical protein